MTHLDTSLLPLLAYSTSTLECAFEIVLVLSTLASLSDIARVNELYPSVVTKVIQPKKYAARHYDLVSSLNEYMFGFFSCLVLFTIEYFVFYLRIRKSTMNCNYTAANSSYSIVMLAVYRHHSLWRGVDV
jgi:hypothetical protein